MSFNFKSAAPPAPPPADPSAGPPAAPTPPAAPAFGGPPPPAAGPTVDPHAAARAFANFGGGEIDVRDPGLPLGATVMVEWLSSEGKTGRNTGFGVYTRVRVVAVADGGAGGGACEPPIPTNLNTMPAAAGAVYVIPIRGFNKPDAERFAISDLKLLIMAALEDEGLTEQVADGLPDDEWNKLAFAVSQNDRRFHGKRFLVQTSKVTTKANFAKVKHAFHPASAANAQ